MNSKGNGAIRIGDHRSHRRSVAGEVEEGSQAAGDGSPLDGLDDLAGIDLPGVVGFGNHVIARIAEGVVGIAVGIGIGHAGHQHPAVQQPVPVLQFLIHQPGAADECFALVGDGVEDLEAVETGFEIGIVEGSGVRVEPFIEIAADWGWRSGAAGG